MTRIDVSGKKVFLKDGTEIGYDKCLIATGRFDDLIAL